MKKIVRYLVIAAVLGNTACSRTDDLGLGPVSGDQLVVTATLVGQSDWKTRAAASKGAVEYGEPVESSDGQYIITATREEWTNDQEANGSDTPLLRGTPITLASDINDMIVKIFKTNTADWTPSSTATDIKATKSGNGYTTSPIYNWPMDNAIKTSVFAFAPYPTLMNGLTNTSSNKVNYTVPTTVADQPDLCVAAPKMNIINSDGTQQIQSFALSHQLTAVGFSMLGWNLKITKITVSGVAIEGALTMNTDGSTSWAPSSTTGSRDVGVTQSLYTHNHNSNYANITTSDGYLMMIPQTLTDAATVTITYVPMTGTTAAGGTTTAKLNDLGVTWAAGDKITYNIRLKTAPAVTSGDLRIDNHKAGYTTSSALTIMTDDKDNLTFSWSESWLKIHIGNPTTGIQPSGHQSPFSINTKNIPSNIYFFTTNDNPSTSAPRTATVTVSGTRSGKKTFDVTQAKGVPKGNYIPTSVIKAAGWTNFPGSKGLQVAMRGNKQLPESGTAAPDDPTLQWKTSNTSTAGVERLPSSEDNAQFGMGKANTDAMIRESATLHPAAKYCRDMGPGWYLPSIKELNLIYDNRDLFGPSYSFTSFNYWSSSEYSSIGSWCIYFGGTDYWSKLAKINIYRVRCVREI